MYKRTRATKTEEGNLRQDEYLINGLQNWDVQNRKQGRRYTKSPGDRGTRSGRSI